MLRQDNYQVFQTKKELYNKQLKDYKSKSGKVSVLRAITFIAGFCFVAVGVADGVSLMWLLGAVFFVAFVFLIRQHSILDRKLNIANTKYMVAEGFCKRFEDKWQDFADTGKEFIEEGDFFVTDVDILGENSLYQKICLGNTLYGRNKLARVLSLKELDEDRSSRQIAISELAEDTDFVVDFTSATKRIATGKVKDSRIVEFVDYCNDEKLGGLPGWAKAVRLILPLVEILFAVAWILGLIHYGYALVGLLVLISFSLLTKHITDSVIGPLYVMGVMLDDYMDVLDLINDKEFSSQRLNDIKNSLCGSKGALVALKKLKFISQAYNISYNPVLHQLLCGTILWDYQLAFAMEKWKKKYASNISDCFKLIGDMEELLSLSVLGILHEHCYGEIDDTKDSVYFEANEMYHPLINQEVVISNDAKFEDGITIITGSNMSGKTTYLRTMAMNLALAYIGAPVCAKKLSASYMKIFTSMRVTDDVAHGISTFYAEILRIKTMSEYKKNNRPMLCLIDEIFKGTNSADRIVGAKEVITKLSGINSMVVVSTHDFELCSLTDKDGKAVVNYHFEEYYDEEQLKFDYKIKKGRCTTTNAKAILRMAGFEV